MASSGGDNFHGCAAMAPSARDGGGVERYCPGSRTSMAGRSCRSSARQHFGSNKIEIGAGLILARSPMLADAWPRDVLLVIIYHEQAERRQRRCTQA